jgi:branched-chain amino acid transport system substrate-binding protein
VNLTPILLATVLAAAKEPVLVGLDLEFGHKTSTSAEAVQRGVDLAIAEINAAGGVLGGRPMESVVLPNRAVPARGVENVRSFAARKGAVAVFCGKFSPVVIEEIPVLHELEMPLLDPWAASDTIVDNGRRPNYVFRLSLRDSWAMHTMLEHAASRGLGKVALLLPNTGWGRSNAAAAEAYAKDHPSPRVVATRWYNWGVESLLEDYEAFRLAGAQAVVFVTNESPGAVLVREMAAMPESRRMPIIAHHGIAGGDLVSLAGPSLATVDLSVVQFFTFVGNTRPKALALIAAAEKRYGVLDAGHVLSAGGLAAAYDLTHLLARAIQKAGTTDRKAIRKALEELKEYDGAVKRLVRPFTPERHEALSEDDLFMARFTPEGALARIAPPAR